MKILLLGANGQVGHELRRSLALIGRVIAATRGGLPNGAGFEAADFDLPDALPTLIQRIAPDVVVNAAAYTAVDRAETESEAAFRINAEAPMRLADACAARDALLVHYSTDYVFDGQGTRPYGEDDRTAPIGVYGASKLAGEEAIRSSGCRHMIFRTAWVYGNHGNNFMRTMLRLAQQRDELRVVGDQCGTPTPAYLIADATREILSLDKRLCGTWHMTASGQTTWYGFAEQIVERAYARGMLSRRPRVVPITTQEFPTPAQRPAYSVLATGKLQSDTGYAMPDWTQGLDHVLSAAAIGTVGQ